MDRKVAEKLVGYGSGVVFPSIAHPGMLESGMLTGFKERLDGGVLAVILSDAVPKMMGDPVEVPLEQVNPSGWGEHTLRGME